jgi:hypothetical protein
MADLPRPREGFLVISDISGYTQFLVGTELEHAQSIVEELTALIRKRLAPPLRFVKLEGDAVFCYDDGVALRQTDQVLDLLELCYFQFSNLLFNMVRSTTCTCAACGSIESLDLKFIVHYGTFLVQRGDGAEDLAGPDVILLHRLLKNSVTEATGIGAYVLLTEAAAGRLKQRRGLLAHSETYDSFGEVSTFVSDLRPILAEMRERHREYLGDETADLVSVIKVSRPREIVWQYLVDPVQRLRWACVLMNKDPDTVSVNELGRVGVGAKVHCNHGPAEAYREIVDWRPFDYFTTRGITQVRGHFLPGREIIETFELKPTDGEGTEVSWRLRFVDRGRFSKLFLRGLKFLSRGGVGHGQKKLEAALAEDLASIP